MSAFSAWFHQLDFSIFYEYGIVILASLLCIMFHEVSHGVTALALGDPTAKNAGRLTFNPIRHIDIWGLIMMAAFRFGWAKPVPVDMRNFRHPVRGMAVTAIAGPVSNLILAWLALAVRAVSLAINQHTGGAVSGFVTEFFEYTAILSVGLAVFNVIPVPPLDGSKVLNAVLPRRAYYFILRYEKYGFLIMMLILFTGVLTVPLNTCRAFLLEHMNSSVTFLYFWVSKLLM